jgi:hypothetical protein
VDNAGGAVAKAVTALALAVGLALAPSVPAHADPLYPSPTPGVSGPTLDPSDTPCYRGSLYCPPPRYSQWGQSPQCVYFNGQWQTVFGVKCP